MKSKTRKAKHQNADSGSVTSEASPAVTPAPEVAPEPPQSSDIITQRELLKRLPLSRRTICNWRDRGIIPAIQVGSKLLFSWESVRAALLRHQRGGN